MSLIAELRRAQAEVLGHQDDPWRSALERALPGNADVHQHGGSSHVAGLSDHHG